MKWLLKKGVEKVVEEKGTSHVLLSGDLEDRYKEIQDLKYESVGLLF